MKSLRNSLAILFAAALMVTIMAVPAFATTETYYTDDTAYYTQVDNSTEYNMSGNVTVTLEIQSKKVNNKVYYDKFDVTLESNDYNGKVTVSDVLVEAMNENTNLHFQNASGVDITNGSASFYQLRVNESNNNYTIYAPTSYTAKNGWMFRINSRFPIHSGTVGTNAQGEDILHAYVKNGEKISLFMDNPISYSDSAYFMRFKQLTYSSTSVTATVQYSRSYYGSAPNYVWNIQQFYLQNSCPVKLYKTTDLTNPVATGNTSSGVVTFTFSSDNPLASGDYYMVIPAEFKTTDNTSFLSRIGTRVEFSI